MGAMVDASYNQQVFQGFNDNGSQTTATSIAATNTNFSRNVDEIFRVRFRIAQTVADANQNNVKGFTLKYQLNGTGGFADVGAQGTSATAIIFANSTNFAHGDAIATGNFRLGTGTGTAVAGEIGEQLQLDNITFPVAGSASYTEVEWALSIVSSQVVNNDTIELRVYTETGTVLGGYTVTPTVTAIEAGGVDFTGTPGAGSLVATGQAPTVSADATVAPTTCAISVAGFAPTVVASSPPTAVEAVNTPATLQVDTNYLVWARVENTGGAGGTAFAWFYNHNAGGWTAVTTTSSVIKAVNATSFADGDDVPELLGGSGTYITNNDAATEDGTPTLPAAFTASGAAEFVLAFQIVGTDVVNNDTILLRLEQADGTDFGTYTNTASITVSSAADVTVTPATGSLAIAGQAPTVAASSTAEPTAGSLTLTGLAPTVAASSVSEPTSGAIAVAGFAPTAAAGSTAEPTTAAIAVTGFAPTVVTAADVTVEPTAGALAATGFAPTVAAGATTEPTTASLSITGFAPTVGAEVSITAEPGTGAVAITGETPSVSAGVTINTQLGLGLPAFQQKGQADAKASQGNDIVPSYPITGLEVGDVFYLHVVIQADTGIACATPSGWTPIGSRIVGDLGAFVFQKIAAGSETGTVAVDWSGTGGVANPVGLAVIYRYRGGGTVETVVTADGTGLTASFPTVGTGGPERQAIAFLAFNDNATTSGSPTGESGGDWLFRAGDNTTTGDDAFSVLYDADMPNGGTISGGSITKDVGDNWNIIAFSIAGGVGATLDFIGQPPAASASSAVTPDTAALNVTGFAPTVVTTAQGTVEIGAVEWLVSYEEIILDFTATPATGSITVTGFAPSVSTEAGFTAEPTAGALTISGLEPTVAASAVAEPTAGALLVTGFAPTVTASALIEPAAGALTAVGQAPTVAASSLATPDPGALTATGLVPGVSTGVTAEPALGALTIVGIAPDVEASGSFSGTPQTAAVTVTGLAPTVAADAAVTPDTASLAITSFAPSVEISVGTIEIGAVEWLVAYEISQQDFTGAPGTGALTITSFAPSVSTSGDATVLPDAGSLAVAGVLPVVAASSTVEPGVGQAVVTGFAPTVSTGAGALVEPGAAALTVTGLAPTVAASSTVVPVTAQATVTGLVPSVSAGATVQPAATAVTITGYAPDVSAVSGVVLTPATGSISFTGHAPSLSTSHNLVPATGSVVVTGYAPAASGGADAAVLVGAGSLVIVGHAPTVSVGFTAIPANANLAMLGFGPTLEGEQVVAPPTGSIAIQGYPPFVIHLPVPTRRTFRVSERPGPFDPTVHERLIPIGENDRQFAVTGRRRVHRVNRRA